MHLPYMRVTDISKHINKHRLYNVVARHTNSILNSTQTDWATVAPPLLRWFFFFKFSYRQKGGGAYGLRIRSAIQILTGIYIEVKWSHFTSTNANTNSIVTSLRVCYFCMSWKQQLVHQTRSLLKHQTYFIIAFIDVLFTFCTRSRCSCIAFYLGICSEARTDMYYIDVCIVAYKNQPLICFAMQETLFQQNDTCTFD